MNALETYDKTHHNPVESPMCVCGYVLHHHSRVGRKCPNPAKFDELLIVLAANCLKDSINFDYSTFFDPTKNFIERE